MSERKFIGLVTDYGEGHYAGVLRAVIKSVAPDVEVIDVEHGIPGFNVIAGAYVIEVSYRWLPRGSIMVGIVDPGVGSSRKPVAVEAGDYIFIGPDNGLLYPAISIEGFQRSVELVFDKISKLMANIFLGKIEAWPLSHTFHGRDLFAPAAALLSLGFDLEDLGKPIGEDDLVNLRLYDVVEDNGVYRVKVIYIDKFGNVVLSCKPEDINLDRVKEVEVEAGKGVFKAKKGITFSSVPEGGLMVYENSFGYVEIAVNRGSGENVLGVKVGDSIKLRPQY